MIDTSVLVAGIAGLKKGYIAGRNPSADLIHKWATEEHFAWLISEEILDEYKEVLRRLRIRPDRIGRTVNLLRERAEIVEPCHSVEISPDPKDDPFCLCAEFFRADFIVTLNPKDFPQERLKTTVILPGFRLS